MEGAKSDRPSWINNTFNRFVREIVRDDVDPLANLSNSVNKLDEGKVNVNDLKISIKLSKDPGQYTVNTAQKKNKSDYEDGTSLDRNDISIKKYKVMLWNSLEDILEVAGYDMQLR